MDERQGAFKIPISEDITTEQAEAFWNAHGQIVEQVGAWFLSLDSGDLYLAGKIINSVIRECSRLHLEKLGVGESLH